MAKKRTPSSSSNNPGAHNPFSDLKGFAVSAVKTPRIEPAKETVLPEDSADSGVDFAARMHSLGVQPLKQNEPDADVAATGTKSEPEGETEVGEEQLFLETMRSLEVSFADQLPLTEEPVRHSPRRMKQIRKGTLIPQATLDLHGLQRSEVEAKLTSFIQNAHYQGWNVLLVITGKGLHSSRGEPVLRAAVEEYLQTQGRSLVAEWGSAPRKYGGDGALIMFLRRQ